MIWPSRLQTILLLTPVMRSDALLVADYLDQLPDDRQAPMAALRQTIPGGVTRWI